MFQLYRMNDAVAIIIMATIVNRLIPIEYLNLFNTLETSIKKFENSTSIEVAPQDMSISNMWQSRAWETCREMLPKNIIVSANIGIYIDLRIQWHPRHQKAPNERREWSAPEPSTDGIENMFIAAISVFLSSRQLIANC
jgi:hypothetical protein